VAEGLPSSQLSRAKFDGRSTLGGVMKKLFPRSVALAVLAAAGPAMAADMPVKAPIGAPPNASVYNWTGLYVGGNVGWAFANSSGTSNVLDPSNPAFLGDPQGKNSGSTSWNGFIGGGQIGYNWMASRNVVLGVEADLSGAALKTNYEGISVDGISYKTADPNPIATIRGRVGYAFGNWLIYGTGGGAWTHVDLTNTQGPCGHGDTGCTMGPVRLGAMDSNSLDLYGWTAGVGVEVGIAPNWTTRFEYLHIEFPSMNFADPVFNRINNDSAKLDVVRLGLNYKFN
jgi:opacity protein-like surface antigen